MGLVTGAGIVARPRAGRLKIGDEWMAIQIIARSQTNPQKAVAELVENSIDAGTVRIRITRGRRRGRVFLRVSDDGRGVPLTPEGIPDFDYVATHVCDSLKRRLDERRRTGVQGEFGIGLLGFWSIGCELEMISQAERGPAYVMTMRAGSRAYDRRRYLGARPGSGVDVTIHDVHREAQIRLTAEKLQRYLGEELRDRVRRSGVTIVLEDRLPPRKTVEVRPAVFRGEPIGDLASIPVEGHPPIRAELYVAQPGDGGQRPRGGGEGSGDGGQRPEAPPQDSAGRPAVALYRLGTRVCRDISALPQFAREPWIGGALEGILDFPDFRLSPASREGFVPDAAYHAFLEALRPLEPRLVDRLRQEEEVRSERASRSLVKELQSAFVRLLRDLPTGEYDWFGAEGARPFAGGSNGRPAGTADLPGTGGDLPGPRPAATADPVAAPDAAAPGDPAAAGIADDAEVPADESSAQPALLTGPLDRVTLRPDPVRLLVGRRRGVRGLPLDAAGLVLRHGLSWSWSLTPGVGSLSVEPDGRAVIDAPDRPARGRIAVTVRAEGAAAEDVRERSASTEVVVEAEAPRRSFPAPKFVHLPGESWRSRWSLEEGKVEVNSGHPDYQSVRKSASRRRRYLGRLYAKELVLHNFGLEPPSVALERLLEVLTRLDEHL
jgi:hypothetical protein